MRWKFIKEALGLKESVVVVRGNKEFSPLRYSEEQSGPTI